MSFEYNPLVSIVIPAYNASNYLSEAIDSALAQSYKKVEIIVVNDGSKDDGATERIAKSYGSKIRYFYKENGGSSSALNYGIKEMNGEWFSWLSHDDLYLKEKVYQQIAYLNKMKKNCNLEENILFCASELIDKDGKSLHKPNKKSILDTMHRVNNVNGNEYLISEPMKNLFHGCSCLIHKNVFNKIGYFDVNLKYINDLDMWFRIYSENYKIHYLPQILVKGRVHSKQVSVTIGYSYHNSEQDYFWRRTYEWLIKNYGCNEKLIYTFGKHAIAKTRYIEGKKAFDFVVNMHKKNKTIMAIKYKALYMNSKLKDIIKKLYLKIKL